MPKQKNFTVSTSDALSAAVVAYRANDQKILRHSLEQGQVENKQRILDYLSSGTVIENSIREQADAIRSTLNQRVMLNTLSGVSNSEFLLQVNQLLQQDTVTNRDFGILAWAPKLHSDIERAESDREQILRLGQTSTFLGQIGKRISLTLAVISSRYLTEFDSFVYMAHDGNGNLVKFWHKKKITSGSTVTAKVKNHQCEERYSNSRVTMLNYVKVIDEK